MKKYYLLAIGCAMMMSLTACDPVDKVKDTVSSFSSSESDEDEDYDDDDDFDKKASKLSKKEEREAEKIAQDYVDEKTKEIEDNAEDILDEWEEEIRESGGEHGYTGNDGASLNDVNNDNAKDIALELYGIDVTADGCTITSTWTNGVNALKVTGSTDIDGKELFSTYFDRCIEHAPDGVFKQEIDWDTLKMSRGEQFTVFEDYLAADGYVYEDFCSGMWLYDFNGHGVQFGYTYDAGTYELSFILMG